MTLPGCYSAGWERKAHECCGRRLQPLTLGHARVLYLAESPFIVPGKADIGPKDLLLAVAICSLVTAPEYAELINLAQTGELVQPLPLRAEVSAFAAYFKYWTQTHPKFSEKQREARIPWPWMYALILVAECGMNERDAWASTCADAFWKAAAISVYNCNMDYATLDQLDTMAEMEAQESADV
jgi:hypothetical protein